MIKGEHDYLKALADINECAEHSAPLLVATHPTDACYVLRCGEGYHDAVDPDKRGEELPSELRAPGHYPDTIRHIPSLTEEFKHGTLPDGPIKDNVIKRSRKKAMSTNKQLQTQVLGELPRADLATGEMLAPETVHALTVYAKKYGLDPYRGHVVIYYGKPYIGLDGYLYKAFTSKRDYQLNTRPLTKEERFTYQVDEGDHAWECNLLFPKEGKSFTGLGIVTRAEMTEESKRTPGQLRSPVVAAHPWQLAQKRAEWQALRRGFPIGESEEVPNASRDKKEDPSTVED